MNGYSKKEFAMIKKLSPFWANLIETGKNDSVMPPEVLKLVAMECFLENKQGKAVDSLRRCVRANRNCDPYRMTPEYEALIELDESESKGLYEVHDNETDGKCPLCEEKIAGCHIGSYCTNKNCGYVDGYAMLTLDKAKQLKEKLGWGTLEERQKKWKQWGLED